MPLKERPEEVTAICKLRLVIRDWKRMKTNLVMGMICLALFSIDADARANTPGSQTEKKEEMKEFMLLVRVPEDYTAEQAKTVNPKWEQVVEKWKADGVFVKSYVFPRDSYVVSGTERQVKKEFVVSDHLKVVSSIILRVSGMEDAVELAKKCPVLDYGGSIEVREIPPVEVLRKASE